MSVDIILKDIEWDGVNKIRVPLEGGGTQDFSIGGGVTPTGNINITQSGQTDVTNYATATVPDGVFDDMVVAVEDGISISVSSGGLITASVESTFSNQHPVATAGWFDTTNTINVVTEGAKTSQLPTQAGATITPTTSQQTAVASGKYTTGAVIVDAVPTMTLPSTPTSTSSGTRKANILPSTSQRYLNIPTGYNATAQYYQLIGMDLVPLNVTAGGTYNASDVDVTGFNTVTVPSGTEGTPTATKGTVSNHSVSVTPSVTNSSGFISGSTKTGTAVTVTANELASGDKSITSNGNNIDVVGYSTVSVNVPSASPNLQTKTRTYTPSLTQQQEVISADAGYDGLLAVGITVDGMPLLTLPDTSSMSATGTRKTRIYPSNYTQYLNIGTGYHPSNEYYEIPAEVLGSKTITTNGTYNASDDDLDGFDSVTVNVSGGSPTLQTKSATYTPTTSQQTAQITADAGYDGLSEVDITVDAVPSGSVTMPPSITASGGTAFYQTQATLVVSASATATPDVTTAGYISSGTSGTTNLVVATTIPTVNAQTLYPSTTDQTIPTNRYTKGTQTIKAVTYSADLIASNIKDGVTIEIGDSDDPDRITSVTGTYTGGGSSKNIQYATGRYEISSTSYVTTGLSIKVTKAGTYKCYWSMDRNTTSGTTGSRLYKGTTALGTAHTSWTYNNNNRNGQVCEETLTFSANDTIDVRARSRSTSYICGVMNFFIVEQ